eukprot:CAMPEP_0171367504 /NCGR_PEP_ID=MMETSP0879-20121228/6125_1 /TAXON_ID=67004 /ORGANISM="Thalassiosira weissflogii, Strain CCMP1336" /LENGTH=316 /DNA_ID=CAMNT_0011875551 /DNA_START=463 /DNA_END=1413 /DNA_ORIENTATION=+
MEFIKKYPAVTPNCISLENNHIGDEGSIFLAGIVGNENTGLEKIKLGRNKFGPKGFQCIAAKLASRKYPMEGISIGSDDKRLNARAFLKFMQQFSLHPKLLPKHFTLDFVNIGVNPMTALSKFPFARSFPLESLVLMNELTYHMGLIAFLKVLRKYPNSSSKAFDINLYGKNDEEVLTVMIAIAKLLRIQNCKMEKLTSHGGYISGESMSPILRSLESNRTLIELDAVLHPITIYEWDHLACVLSDTRTRISTYASNHLLVKFSNVPSSVPSKVRWLLAMNTLPDKATVGIMKVVDCHVAPKFRLDPFIDMKPSLY